VSVGAERAVSEEIKEVLRGSNTAIYKPLLPPSLEAALTTPTACRCIIIGLLRSSLQRPDRSSDKVPRYLKAVLLAGRNYLQFDRGRGVARNYPACGGPLYISPRRLDLASGMFQSYGTAIRLTRRYRVGLALPARTVATNEQLAS
jgi:hypothetical protein